MKEVSNVHIQGKNLKAKIITQEECIKKNPTHF